MGQSELFVNPSGPTGSDSPLPTETIDWILDQLGAGKGPGNRALMLQVVRLVLRLYILKSMKVNDPQRLKELTDSLIRETLGHTRVD
jgi:hypothetical protein